MPPPLDLILSSVATTHPRLTRTIPNAISERQITAILRRPIGLGVQLDGSMMITSSRDQIEATLGGAKTDIRDTSGSLDHAISMIPKTLTELSALLPDHRIGAFGVNFIAESQLENAEEWLGTHLLNTDLTERIGLRPKSNAVALRLDQPPKTMTIKFDSRDNSALVVNFNASESADPLPTIGRLAEEIQEQFTRFQELLGALGLELP